MLGFLIPIGSAIAVAFGAYKIAELFGAGEDVELPIVENYPIQTTMKGIPIPKIYGTERVAGNVIWAGPWGPYVSSGDHYDSMYNAVEAVTIGVLSGGTGYKRSFLLSLCEGPATILKAWKDDEEISLSDFTWFYGNENVGIRLLTGEDYGDWPNQCFAFFNQYSVGTSKTMPNFTFVVTSGATDYPELLTTSSQADPNLTHTIPISNVNDLQDMNNNLAGNYYLTNDIDASATSGWNGGLGFEPIGTFFTGTLDGCGHTISNLFINRSSWVGLFYGLRYGAKIANLTLSNINYTGWSYMGGLSGEAFISDDLDILIQNVHVTGTIYSSSVYGGLQYTGGMVGRANKSTGSYTGIIYHYDCSANVTIDQTYCSGEDYRGGFVGAATDCAVFQNCHADGSLVNPADGNSVRFVGGFGGYFQNVTILYCYATGDVNGGSLYWSMGGFAGCLINCDVDKCYAKGDVIGYQQIGGLVGASEGGSGISDCYAHGNATGTKSTTCATGGLCGSDSGTPSTYTNCYSTGSTTGDGAGGLFGESGTATITNCFWDTEASGNPTSDGGTGHDTEWMKTQANFEDAGWDFDDIWIMGDSIDEYDMNPADIIRDIIENDRYGAGRTDIIDDDSLDACGVIWESMGFLISIKINAQKPWQDWVDYILANVGGARFNSGGKLHFGVLYNQSADDNITADDFVREKGKPAVEIVPRQRSDTFNKIIVGWIDRDNRYSRDYVTAEDPVDQRRWGLRKKTINLDGIHDRDQAILMAHRMLIDGLYRFNTYKFTLTFNKVRLDKFNVVNVTDGELLSSKRMRIMNISEERNGRGLDITAMDDLAEHYPDFSNYQSQENLYDPADAVTLSDAAIYFREDIEDAKIHLSVVPGSAYFNGAFILRSYDDVTYEQIGWFGVNGVTSGDANAAGMISGSLAAHGSFTWAPDESVLVNIGTVTDLKTSITEDQFWNDQYLARIGSEIIAFKTAVETATPGIWRISNLRRGLFGTEPIAHYSGETFCTLVKDFTYDYEPGDIGKTLYFKAAVFYGNVCQIAADLTGSSVTIGGHYRRPAAASLLRLSADENDGGSGEYSGSSFTLYWDLGSRVSGFNHGDWLNLPWNNYIADAELQAIVLRFEQTNGTLIGERSIAVANSATITKATDLGGFDDAVIKVIPRRLLRSRLENSILVESV